MPKVFISYVRDNSDQVDKLADELRHAGVTVWLDRNEILPGADWKYAIRQAIRKGDYFIACFSAEYVARPLTYMNTEIGLAVEMLEQMPPGRIWFIPVLLSECEIPDRTIGGGQTLRDLQWEPLHKDRVRGVRRVLEAMGVERKVYEPELIRIPAGEFLMGDDKHPVDVAEFYIGKYPITNVQYTAFVKAKNYDRPEHWKDGRIPAGKESHPVVYVSWHDSVAFCDWLSQATGREFRLPTEAEWEKAARGGLCIPGPGGALMDNPLPARQYPWGGEFDAGKCNTLESGIKYTTPVGKYSPKGDSPYSVADMAGNVWEWCSSLDRDYAYNADDGRVGRVPLTASVARVLRGGAWYGDQDAAAASYRNLDHPDGRFSGGGFRVVAGLAPAF